MIFTVIIALEFKRSLLVVAERRDSVVQVRSVILIALLAVVRKLIILDLSSTDAFHLLALAAAILALGAVYWLVRDQGQPRETIPPAYSVHDHGYPACQGHDRLLHSAAPGDLHGPGLEP